MNFAIAVYRGHGDPPEWTDEIRDRRKLTFAPLSTNLTIISYLSLYRFIQETLLRHSRWISEAADVRQTPQTEGWHEVLELCV